MYYKKEFGANGEDIAFDYLAKNGYSIINRNFTCRMGEIDIIALDDSQKDMEIVFIEVKTRRDARCGQPAEAVDLRKMRHIIRVAQFFIMMNKLEQLNCRFDVIEILHGDQINHIKNAFDYSSAFSC